MPTVIVCMGYESFYDDYEEVNVHEILDGIPSRVVLKYVAENLGKVIYSQSNTRNQKQLIRDYCHYVPDELKKKIWRYLKQYPDCELYETYGCSLLYGLILQNYTPYTEGDDELYIDEYEPVFKALTYCNKRWTDEQEIGAKVPRMIDLSIKIDIPIVEFKRYKDFKFQVYKAIPFFKYLESEPYYRDEVLPAFYEDHKIESWKQYISRIVTLYGQSFETSILDVSRGTDDDFEFFSQFVANHEDAECSSLWNGHNALAYLRSHFLYPLEDKKFLLLNANFLIDKIYQGVKFDLFATIRRHAIKNKRGKNYRDYPEFSSVLGTDFSESHLLYALMSKTFAGKYDAMYTGAEMKERGVEAEPDLYMRIGKSLFLFEFKDVTLGDSIKYSDNIDVIKEGIKQRICLYTEEKRKGAGQLHFTIENIARHSMDALDPSLASVNTIYPLVVVTDRAFSAIGVQALVIEENNKFPSIPFEGLITIPIVIDFDTLIDLSYRIHSGRLQFESVLGDYILNCGTRLAPFSNFVYDNYPRNHKNGMSNEETRYLFEGMFE